MQKCTFNRRPRVHSSVPNFFYFFIAIYFSLIHNIFLLAQYSNTDFCNYKIFDTNTLLLQNFLDHHNLRCFLFLFRKLNVFQKIVLFSQKGISIVPLSIPHKIYFDFCRIAIITCFYCQRFITCTYTFYRYRFTIFTYRCNIIFFSCAAKRPI